MLLQQQKRARPARAQPCTLVCPRVASDLALRAGFVRPLRETAGGVNDKARGTLLKRDARCGGTRGSGG